MAGKLGKAIVLALVLSMVITGTVFADDESPLLRIRSIGEITGVFPETSSFALHQLNGEDLHFFVTEWTNFHSRNGEIKGINDLSAGMKVLVLAIQDGKGHLIALVIAVARDREPLEVMRSSGTITRINSNEGVFLLESKNGEIQEFEVGSRTRYRIREGSMEGLSDLDPGMFALVIAIVRDGQIPMAVWVGARQDTEPVERLTVIGEILNVIPGQETFDLQARNGDVLHFSVIERTKFRSWDGSIEELHDLERGMYALVVYCSDGQGSLIALGIAAGYRNDRPDLSEWDLWVMGRITSMSDRSFTIESRNQGNLTFPVDGSTHYRSRDGSVNEFKDLQVGMVVVVGAKELGNGQYVAGIVGAGSSSAHRSILLREDLLE
jgi:hypothetical protein